jgi:hypothetical protein
MRLMAMALTMMFALNLIAVPAAAKRVALVIANSKYATTSPLKNPPADAKLIAGALRQAGFDDVMVKTDLGKMALEGALRDFGIRSEGADVALIYYAGHGIEAGGQNYIIPVDAQLVRDRDLDVEATRLDTALLMAESARMRIIILDACRNNPFAASMQRTVASRAVGRGLAQIEPTGETLVVYAAKAGSTAADGEGANSPFAEALAKRLPQPGLEISLLFRAVRDDVLAKTGRTQEPFTYGSLSGQAFYFRPVAQTAAMATSTPTFAAPSVSAETTEVLFWQGALSANSETAYRSYLSRYPQGLFAGLADENLKRLTKPTNSTEPRANVGRPSASLPPSGERPSPSFSCAAPKLKRVEQMICQSPSLATADREFGKLFSARLVNLAGDARVNLIRGTAESRKRRDACPTQGCIAAWYNDMTASLQDARF